MTMDDPVLRALADLADADASRHAPPHLERTVLDAFDRQGEQGYLQRSAATVWAHRREAVAIAVAVGVTTTIYFEVLDRVVVRSPLPERPVQSQVSRPVLPPALEHLDAQEPRLTSPPSAPQPTRRARTRGQRPVQSVVDQNTATWKESDDIVHSVHVRVSRTMLPLLGVPIIEPDAAGMVNVELLLGNDGLARTIRIVP